MEQAYTPSLETLNSSRYTIDGSEELERRLGEICESLRDRLISKLSGKKIELLLLGGGYGRGEGGVYRTWEGDKPYNDLEFYLFLPGSNLVNQRMYGGLVHQVAEMATENAGIEVEVKVLSLRKLAESGPSMFYYDLLCGHKVVHGAKELLQGCEHHKVAESIPLYEATRLLMNRASGLLYAKERLAREEFSFEEADFVHRNICKAKLAFGDVILAARKQYHWSCRERHDRLLALDFPRELDQEQFLAMHAEGVEFKLHPISSIATRDELLVTHAETVAAGERLWLWLENLRLGEQFRSGAEYALSPARKCPETARLKNMAINVREFGAGTIFDPKGGYYPRERLLNSLPLLLWHPEGLNSPKMLAHLQTQLRTEASGFAGLVSAYEALWRKFN